MRSPVRDLNRSVYAAVQRGFALGAVTAILTITGCGKRSDSQQVEPSGTPADDRSSCPERPSKQVTASAPELATPFSRAHQRSKMAKEWSEDDWRSVLECPDGATPSKESDGSTLTGSCRDADSRAQGWKAEVSPFGSPMLVEQWRDGKRHGLSVYYEPDMFSSTVGSPMIVTHYREGAAHGPHYLFTEGRLRIEGVHEAGARSGCAYEWHASGKLSARGAFSSGRRDGVWETWHPDGTPQARARFSAGAIGKLERFENGKWQPASAPPENLCSQFAKLTLGGVVSFDGELHYSVLAELADYRDSCMLHMTKLEAECILCAGSEQERARCSAATR